MFGLLSRNLPRVKAGAHAFSAAALNSWPDASERSRPVTGSGAGIELSQLPGGIGFRQTRLSYNVVAIATSDITAGVLGGAYGTGSAAYAQDNGTGLAPGAVTYPLVKNYHDKKFNNGSVVLLTYANGSWWAADIDSCTHLS